MRRRNSVSEKKTSSDDELSKLDAAYYVVISIYNMDNNKKEKSFIFTSRDIAVRVDSCLDSDLKYKTRIKYYGPDDIQLLINETTPDERSNLNNEYMCVKTAISEYGFEIVMEDDDMNMLFTKLSVKKACDLSLVERAYIDACVKRKNYIK